ncbi:MAG: hypothetical protein EP347_06510 [Alphaproteobacteria bacterium]|nr:MAG: hypothetical protein EP347_06510 [Alphaproteobacteria bacterium]
MKSGGPWSVKGIEPEVRETAKSAARKAGKTLGEWLNQVIMESGQPGAEEAAELLKDPSLWENYDGRAPWSEALEDMAAKLDASEKHHQSLLKNIDRAIAMLAERMASQSASDKSGGKGPDLSGEFSKRLTALEEGSKRNLLKDDLKSVEGAMGQVASVLDRNNKRHEDRFHAVDSSFNELRARLEETERQVTEALGRIESSFDDDAAVELHDKIVTTFTEDLADIDERIHAVQERTEQSLEQVQHNISDIVSQLSTSGVRIDAAITAPLEKAKNAVAEVSRKVDAQTAVYEARVGDLEASIESLVERFDKASDAEDDQRVSDLEKGLGDLNARLAETQREQQDALAQIRGSLDSLVSRLDEMEVSPPQAAPRPQAAPELTPEPAKEPLSAPQPAPKLFGLRKKPVAEAVQASQSDDYFSAEAPTEFDQLVQPEAGAEPSAETQEEDVDTSRAESKLGWAAKAFRKTEPLDDEVEPYAPEEEAAEPSRPSVDVESLEDETFDLTETFFEGTEDALSDLSKIAAEEGAPESLEDALRREGPTSTKSRQRKSVDDYFTEGPIKSEDSRGEDFDLDLPRSSQEEDEGPTLNTLRNQFFSQADDEADNLRGALSEIIDPDRREGKRRTLLWVIGGLIMALMIVGSVLILSGGAKDILNVSGRPDLLQDIGQTFKNLVSPESAPEALPATSSQQPTPEDGDGAPPPDPDESASAQGSGAVSAEVIPASHIGSPNYFQVAVLSPAEGLLQAAEDGSAKAQYALALAYANGTAVPQDQAKAVSWYRIAAGQGLAPAQYRLAARLEQGDGTTKDPEAAFNWYQKAAKGGNRNAMHNLAVAHAQGNGTEQDLKAAAHWFERSAMLGLADSQYNLGLLYARGLGVEPSNVEAYKWFALSQKSGRVNAEEQLTQLRPLLTSGDLNYIDLFVESWAPLPLDPIANGQFDVAPEAYSDRARRAIIARAQSLLAALGFAVASEDGIIDPSTQEAVRSFQSLSNLPTTGAISSDLLSRLEAQAQ